MTSVTTQPPKKGRTRRRRLWVYVSTREIEAAKRVTKAEGLAKGVVLRRYSVEQIVEKARLLDGNQA